MIVSMAIEMSDTPGELQKALEPIADHGGNIVSVAHHRGDVTPRGTLQVELTFEVVKERLDDVIEGIEGHGLIISKLGEERFHESVTVLLVGHIVSADITDTITAIESAGVKVIDFKLAMPDDPNETSSARLTIKTTTEATRREALAGLDRISEEKGFLFIEPVGVR